MSEDAAAPPNAAATEAEDNVSAPAFWYRWDRGPMDFYLSQYKVVKTTPKGVVLDCYGKRKFVLLTSHKQFACPTKEAAEKSYLARKKRQIEILSAQLVEAEEALQAFQQRDKSKIRPLFDIFG